MIIFDMTCGCGYQFEAWFQGHDDYEQQKEEGLLQCPRCAGTAVHKILSPVAVRSSWPPSLPAAGAESTPDSEGAKALALLRGLKKYVETNFEDVGVKLAEEALKIHYGVTEARNLRGVVTPQEEKTLAREGVELLKVPVMVDDNDDKLN